MDILCLNETESEIITGLTVTSVDEARIVTSVLLERGCQTVIVTLGAQGAVYATKDQTEAIHVPTTCVEAVDTTVSADRFFLPFPCSLLMLDNVLPSLACIETLLSEFVLLKIQC